MRRITSIEEIEALPCGTEVWLEEFNFYKATYHKQLVRKARRYPKTYSDLTVFSPEEDNYLDFQYSGYGQTWMLYID